MPTPRIQKLSADMAATDGITLTAYRANPITFRITLDSARPLVDGVESLRAEIRRSVTDYTTPLAVTEINAPTGAGPVDISFTGAQMNQDLDGKASGLYWLVIYTVDDAGETLDIWHAGKITLKEHAASLTAGAPPNTVGPISKAAADLLYATLAGLAAERAERIAADATFTFPPAPMAGLVINTALLYNTKSVSADTVVTFGGVPPTGGVFGLRLTNTSGTARTITVPTSFSDARQALTTTVTLPANGVVSLQWYYDGVSYYIFGDHASVPSSAPGARSCAMRIITPGTLVQSGVPTRIPLNDIICDVPSAPMGDLVNGRINITRTGRYLISGSVQGEALIADCQRFISIIRVNNVQMGDGETNGLAGGYPVATVPPILRDFTAGDAVDLWAYQNSGTAINMRGTTNAGWCSLTVLELL